MHFKIPNRSIFWGDGGAKIYDIFEVYSFLIFFVGKQ